MNDLIHGLENFRLHEAQADSLRYDFSLLIADSHLSRCERTTEIITNLKDQAAIYFWIMRLEEKEFKIYIGRTKCISSRIKNYISEFQPHSPNDYKLQIFHSFIAEVAPHAVLDLYFSERNKEDLKDAEKWAISEYDPLLNRRTTPSTDERLALRDAFSSFYRLKFERLLGNGA